MNRNFWQGKKVFVTGHTGFKGTWLCLVLKHLGANVIGFALPPPTTPNLFDLCKISNDIHSIIGDIRELNYLSQCIKKTEPDIIFHMAAQSLVHESYQNPVETYEVNVIGTVNLLEAVRRCGKVKAIVNVTTDKCYENKEWDWGYRENDNLGGYDPYSNSKACSELVTQSYIHSFFNTHNYSKHGMAIATARAGNVIGGGDWAKNRLIVDCVRSIINKEQIVLRNPHATRPWQHVLEPLYGYLSLAEYLYEDGPKYSGGWNFGPEDTSVKSVYYVVNRLCELWDDKNRFYIEIKKHEFHETNLLKLDCSKAKSRLKWQPVWDLEHTLRSIVDWNKSYVKNENMREVCMSQINTFLQDARI